ncbi:MFS transporter [Asanoa ishikariensis]|uniref:Predicted arabinose efflux permease, MFS family n=1 Tax=Asanoa ishikariensis TaxID=137265 RepID=A0A1H3KV18_9ACTN|nr:MFS transporter [Asanoa ishikariensis]GIF69680.1 MFS transporter [Asanoa ishikariensis]SDY55866.1 Predicted arabinose efflux permease, MFS family [Asanoa ishikariensis]
MSTITPAPPNVDDQPRPGMLAPLRHSAFRYLVAGRTTNMLGNAVAPIALAFAVLDLTGSARDLGLVVGVRSLANVIFVLFGGVIADRLPRHLVMVGASVLAGATQAVVAFTVLTGTATIPLLLGLSAVNGVAAALAFPAISAMMPQTVPSSMLQQANAINRLAFNSAMIAGSSLGGVLVATAGPGWGLAVDAGTFFLGGLLFSLVRVTKTAEATATERPGIFAEMRLGWTAFASRTWLWAVVAGFCVINAALTGSLSVLGPVVADSSFGRTTWGLILAVETAGMIVGALVAMRVRTSRLLFYGVLWCLGDVLLVLALGLTSTVLVLLLAGFAVGFALEQFTVAWDTTMQEHVPSDLLARVYSYDMLGSILAVPIGQVLAGPLAEHFGVRHTLLGAAALIGLATLAMLLSRDVRHLRHAI